MGLGSIAQSLQVGLGQVPPVAIALGLLAGPTALLIGYRFVTVARRMRMTSEVHAATLWVCHSCRSVNELRLNRCYRCGSERGAIEEAEVVSDRPASPVRRFEVPAGSPFMAAAQQSQGIPVMDPATGARDPVAVGPGGDAKLEPSTPQREDLDLVEADDRRPPTFVAPGGRPSTVLPV